jgi:hypothetical protein
MWLWIKTKIALMMMAVGIDWPNVDDGDKLNAAIGVVIGMIGVGLGVLAYKLSRRQTELAEHQHQVMMDELTRKAVLTIAADASRQTDTDGSIEVGIHNSGTKSTSMFYWELIVDDDLLLGVTAEFKGSAVEDNAMDDVPCTRWTGVFKGPVYPTRTVYLGRFKLDKSVMRKPLHVRWTINSEAGVFPQPGMHGSFTVAPEDAYLDMT